LLRFGKLPDKAISATMRCLDIGRRSSVVVQSFAKLPDAVLKDSVTDEYAWPNCIQYFLFAYSWAGCSTSSF
jgi:hypothetical protein